MILLVFVLIVLIGIMVVWTNIRQAIPNEVIRSISTYMKEEEQLEQRKRETLEKHQQLINQIKQIDANFSYVEFEKLVRQTTRWAIEAKSTNNQEVIQQLRTYASASFLNDYVHGLSKIKEVGIVTYRNVKIEEFYMEQLIQHHDYDEIKVIVMVRYDYANFERSTLVRQKEMKSKLELVYSKHKERIGIEQEYEAMTHCKNCGAAIDVIHDEKCPYCDSYFYTKSNIWMLHELIEFPQELYGLS